MKTCPFCFGKKTYQGQACPYCAKPRKYRNQPQIVDGHPFASRREANRYSQLVLLQREGLIQEITLQPRFPIVIAGIKICTYVADFKYRTREGIEIVEDVKGVRTAVYKLKKKLLKAIYKIEIREI